MGRREEREGARAVDGGEQSTGGGNEGEREIGSASAAWIVWHAEEKHR